MKKSDSIEKKPYGTGKVVFLSFLCVLLTLLLSIVLLGCVTARQLVHSPQIGTAASDIPLQEVVLPNGTRLPQYINETYIKTEGFTDEKMANILRDGTFSTWVGSKAEMYAHYLAGDDAVIHEVQAEEIADLLTANDSTIQLHTGIHGFSAENPRVIERIKPDIAAWNAGVHSVLAEGASARLLSAGLSSWIWIVLGVLLLLVMVWLIVIHAKGKRHIGTAFKTFAVPAFIPSLLVFLAGACGEWVLGLIGCTAYQKAWGDLHAIPMTVGGIAALGCIALFGFGILWNAIAQKPADYGERVPAYDPADLADAGNTAQETVIPVQDTVQAPDEPEAPEPAVIRHYCRFCGQELVNQDAKFCYKCGKPQE